MRAVIIISGLRGVFHASLEIARRLGIKGFTVELASSSDLHGRLDGYPYSFVQLPETNIPESFQQDFHLKFLEAIDQLEGDLFIVDLECPVYILTCLAAAKKVLILNHFLPIPTFADCPIPNLDTSPGEGSLGNTIGVKASWLESRAKLLVKANLERIKKGFKDRRSLLILLGDSMGLKAKDYLYSRTLLPGPYLYFSKVPMLHITAEELDFRHRLRANEHYVGPMILLGRVEASIASGQSEIDVITSKARSAGKKLIYCSFSSYRAVSGTFLQKLVQSFSQEQDWELVVGLGEKSQKPSGEIPENVHFFKWVPALKILPHADCALITAGFHVIHECIHFEVPMLSYSLGITDQNGFQARIRSKKLGLTGKMEIDSAEDISLKVKTLLSNKDIKISLQKMKANFAKYQDEQILEKLISPSE